VPPPEPPTSKRSCAEEGFPDNYVRNSEGQCVPPDEGEEEEEEDEKKKPCDPGYFRDPLTELCVPYPRQWFCPPGTYFDWVKMGCVQYYDPSIPPAPPGRPGTPFPPRAPGDPTTTTTSGYSPAEKQALDRGKILSERREADGSCPAGTVEVEPGSKYCMVPDKTPEQEDKERQAILKCQEEGKTYNFSTGQCDVKAERVAKNDNGSCPSGYQPEIDLTQGGYTGFCVPQGTYDDQDRDGGGGDGDTGDTTDGDGDFKSFFKTCPNGDVVAVGDPCPNVEVEEIPQRLCYLRNGSMMWVPENEPCPGDSFDEKGGAAGGIVKKGRIKKYQTGGIASLPARDPRMGGAMNPADGYNFGFAEGGMAAMPEYQAGGKLLRGPGDGMSDDIPAVIRGKGVQRAALADGEFVIPADVVSHLGNGSTEAGAKKLYKMMEQIRRARTGTGKQAPQVNTDKFLPRVTPAKKRR